MKRSWSSLILSGLSLLGLLLLSGCIQLDQSEQQVFKGTDYETIVISKSLCSPIDCDAGYGDNYCFSCLKEELLENGVNQIG